MMTTDTIILGDLNAHNSTWYSSSIDSRGTMLESVVSGFNFVILNWDSLTRLPDNANQRSPGISLASSSLITSTNWKTKSNLCSDHLPILISLQMDATINPIQDCFRINLRKENLERYSREIEDKMSKRPTAKKEKRSCVPWFLKQHHTTYPLDDTDSTQSQLQLRYWKR